MAAGVRLAEAVTSAYADPAEPTLPKIDVVFGKADTAYLSDWKDDVPWCGRSGFQAAP